MNPAVSPEKIIATLCAERPVLAELRALFPEAWETIYGELQALAEQQDPARLAERLTQAHRDWQEIQPACRALRQKYSPWTAHRCALGLIRKIAIEQYCRAVQQQALKAGGAVGLRDRLLFRLLILPLATARRALPVRLHRMAWRLLHNPAAATAMLMEAGCYLITPAELVRNLQSLIASRPTLEIGAGRGILTSCLQRAGTAVTAVDDFSWASTIPIGPGVLELDGRDALDRFQPQVVICCWPPPGNTFEQAIFSSPGVQDYIVIISRHRHASGNHQVYAGARDFRCVQASGLLAEMLLPAEAESVLYIFSRKDRKN